MTHYNVFHPEGSLAADLWVMDRALRILFGEAGQVVKGIRQDLFRRLRGMRIGGSKRVFRVADEADEVDAGSRNQRCNAAKEVDRSELQARR